MKKTNGRSQWILTNATLPDYREEVHRKERTQHSKQPPHEHGMMHNQV